MKLLFNTYKDQQHVLLGVCFLTLTLTFVGTNHTMDELVSLLVFKKLLYNFVVTSIAWLSIRAIIIFFDNTWNWNTIQHTKRWVTQIFTTTTFVSLISYSHLYSRQLVVPNWEIHPRTTWLTDYPLILVFTLAINFLYYHLWTQQMFTEKEKIAPIATNSLSNSTPKYTAISIKKGKKVIQVSQESIAYAFRQDEFNYLVTKTGEKHLLDCSLNTLEENLNSDDFFRINRKSLAHRKAVQSFQTLSNRHIQVILHPEITDDLLVNKNKAARFKKWMENSQ